MTGKQIEKKRADTDKKVRGLGNLKSEYFEASEGGFHNLIYQKTGTTKVEIRYVIRNRVVPEVFPDVAMERMHQIRLSGEAFGEDNQTVLQMLKEYPINSPGCDWIQWCNATDTGFEAFCDLLDHYNAYGELIKNTHLAVDTLKRLQYKKEQSMLFEKY